MPVIIDELTGTVEPPQPAGSQQEQPQAGAGAREDAAEALRRELRRLDRRAARLRAD